MSQVAGIIAGHLAMQVELPDAEVQVMPGVHWGAVDVFPTPAYWAYQVLARRVLGSVIRHRLGRDLSEEVAACLLGGHGIPAEVGLAAFRRLRDAGALHGATEADLLKLLSEPLEVSGRRVRYRFAAQKAKYVHRAMRRLGTEEAPTNDGMTLRNWLVDFDGIGLKTASWIARNLLDADDVAILDIHIVRAGMLFGIFDRSLTVERHYRELEARFISFSQHLNVRTSELDSVIWLEMKMSPTTVHRLLNIHRTDVAPAATAKAAAMAKTKSKNAHAPDKRCSDSEQPSLFK